MPVDPEKRHEFLDWLSEEYGPEVVVTELVKHTDRIPFVSPMLTWATCGGVPIGHMCRWYGPEGCLAEDTFLRYEIRKPTGECQNHKGGTIESLYLKFNGLNRPGHDVRRRRETIDSEYFLSCMNDAGSIFHNKVVGVIKTGSKPCLRITTASDNSIVATADHKFFVGNGYVPASELDIGDQVFIHNNTRRNGRQPRIHRPQTTVKYHPYGQFKTVNGYDYKQLYISRLVVEADMNGMSYEEYRRILNDDGAWVSGLEFLHPDLHVHHVNEDCTDNSLSNLAVITADEHNRQHALKDHDNLRFVVVEDEIVSINDEGERETYDVQMADPFNNFVAGGIVVHNSGKSLTNWGLIAAAQRYPETITELYEADIHWLEHRGNKFSALKRKKDLERLVKKFPDGMSAIIFDTEQRASLELAAHVGCDTKKDMLEVIDEQIIEYIIDQMKAAIEAYHIVIIDSASNAETIAEDTEEPGDASSVGSAARMWKRLKQVRKRFDRSENTMIIVDQMRTNIQMSTLGRAARSAGPPTAPPNVRFLRHNSSLSIEFDVGTKLYLDKNDNLTDDYEKASSAYKSLGTNGKEPHGLEMRCKVQKNSTGRPYRNSRMRFRFPVADVRTGELKQEIGFDREFEMLEIATHFEIIESGGGGMFYLLDESFERIGKPYQWKGESAARTAILEDEELQDRIMQRLMADT